VNSEDPLAPDRAVTEYFEKTGLQHYLNQIWWAMVARPVGNSGPLEPAIEELHQKDIVAASVLSGNRNFEARVHQSIKANFDESSACGICVGGKCTVIW